MISSQVVLGDRLLTNSSTCGDPSPRSPRSGCRSGPGRTSRRRRRRPRGRTRGGGCGQSSDERRRQQPEGDGDRQQPVPQDDVEQPDVAREYRRRSSPPSGRRPGRAARRGGVLVLVAVLVVVAVRDSPAWPCGLSQRGAAGRDERPRQDVGRDHRERHGQGHRPEQELAHARASGPAARAPGTCRGSRPARASPPRWPRGRPPPAGVAPRPRCRCVFSRQMIALSTIGPIASVSPARVITLIVLPVQYRQMHRRQDRDRQRHDGDRRHPPLAQEQQDRPASRAPPRAPPPATRLSIDWRT